MTTSSDKICPNCGEPLRTTTSLGLCPRCLLTQYLTPLEETEPLSDSRPEAATAQDHLADPHEVFGNYVLLEEIGRGGMGVVYLARQLELDRIVALKMLMPSRLTSATDLQRFRLEIETAGRLEHPHILPIYDVGEIGGQPYYTTKYLEGGSLAQRSARLPGRQTGSHRPCARRFITNFVSNLIDKAGFRNGLGRCSGPSSSDSSIELSVGLRADTQLFLQICQAVAHAHARGVLHRDLKPANILLDREGDPHVADFGLARLLDNTSDLTLSQAMIGTPAYAAPEQLREGTRHLTTAADVYSLGAILYELLAGRPPLCGPTAAETIRQVLEEEPRPLRNLNPHIDRDLEAICRKCLEKDPRRRYTNAGELAGELEHYLAREPIQARPLDTVSRAWRWCRRRPALAGLIGSLLLALSTVAMVSTIAAIRIAHAREGEQRAGYYNQIALASSLIEKGDIQRARETLAACPERYRDWEWGHLLYRCHQEILSIHAHMEVPIDGMTQFSGGINRLPDIQFDAHGRHLATRGSDGTVKIWSTVDGRQLSAVSDPSRPAVVMAFHPTQDMLAVGFADHTIELWNTKAWRSFLSIDLESEPARHLAWAPDGPRLAAAGRHGFVIIDPNSENGTYQPWISTDVGGIRFTADGKRLVVQHEAEARLYRPDSLEEESRIAIPADAAGSLFLDPLAQRWVTIDSEGMVTLWQDAENKTPLHRIQGVQAWEVRRVFFSPDGQRFCTGGEDGTARIWDASTGTELFAVPSRVYRAQFSPDGRLLATLGAEDIAYLWDVETKRQQLALHGHAETILTFDLAPDGRRLATASRDGVVKLWSTRAGRERLPEQSWIWGVSISPDGSQIVTAPWGSHQFTIWDAFSGQRRLTVDTMVQGVTWSSFSPDGCQLVTIGHDKIGRVWDTRTGELLLSLRGHTRCSDWVTYSPDGQHIAMPCRDGTVRIWDARTGDQIHCFEVGTEWVYGAFFTPDSQRLFVTGLEGLSIWDVASGNRLPPLPQFPNLQGPPTWVVFGPGINQFSVTGAAESSVYICELPSGREVGRHDLRGFAGGWAFSPDANRLVIPATRSFQAGYDTGTAGLELWDTQVRRRVVSLEGHSGALRRAYFSGDGLRIVSLSWDLELRQWDAFPWSNSAYPGADNEPFLDRVQLYAMTYWRQRLEVEEHPLPDLQVQPPREILWPVRDAHAGPNQLDLGFTYNALLSSTFAPFFSQIDSDNDLSALPIGTVELSGAHFDIRGVIQLRRGGVELLETPAQLAWQRCPVRVENIPIGRKFHRLHVLHGTVGPETPGKVIARWIWQYAPDPSRPGVVESFTASSTPSGMQDTVTSDVGKDGGRERFLHLSEVRYGDDVRDWWFTPGEEASDQPGQAHVVWIGSNPRASEEGRSLRLYLSTWDNPRPDVRVESLTCESALTDSAPFLIAVTVK